MGQITRDFVEQMLTHCERKEHPPLTVWEAAQLAQAWLDREKLRTAAAEVIEFNRCHANDQYGDSDKAESWACVRTLRAALLPDNAEVRGA